MNTNTKKIIFALIGIVLIGLLIAYFVTNKNTDVATESESIAITGDPIDAVMEFYDAWHSAELSTSTNPYTENLLTHPRLSEKVRAELTTALSEEGSEVNPVLCQTSLPPRIGSKVSYILDNQSEVHVLARGFEKRSPRMAVIKLIGQNGDWVINNIDCVNGESGPEREFNFDREGFLLKSVPPPLNPDYWHLVFEENGKNGHTAPLFFSDSVCTALDGSTATCNPDSFTDATKALVQGEMTEAGVDVKRVTFVE